MNFLPEMCLSQTYIPLEFGADSDPFAILPLIWMGGCISKHFAQR